ncbi:hypothetical protein BYT27DRAFT_7213735 [Phlegmacium glaucopus]|nr:hypothetical protein BYT27DRAFT_7213735 [Phlegmacium glaucopus]
MDSRGSIQSSTRITYSGRQRLDRSSMQCFSSPVTRQHYEHQSECLSPRMKLEFFASPPLSENLPLVPRLSVLPRDDQELQELCAKVRVLEVRPVEYAKLILDLEERHAEFEIFLPGLQAKLRKLQDELTGCETRRKSRIKNIVNGYPECKKDVDPVEKREVSYEETLIHDFEIE